MDGRTTFLDNDCLGLVAALEAVCSTRMSMLWGDLIRVIALSLLEDDRLPVPLAFEEIRFVPVTLGECLCIRIPRKIFFCSSNGSAMVRLVPLLLPVWVAGGSTVGRFSGEVRFMGDG